MPSNNFKNVFGNTPVFGMLHLAGSRPAKRALEELAVYESEGVTGVIVENYHGNLDDVVESLDAISKSKTSLFLGLNVLPNEYFQALPLASSFGAKFIQLDYVAGNYVNGRWDVDKYDDWRMRYPEIFVLGGVWPKYYLPVESSDLENDLKEGMQRADAIVVTGEGTGIDTPMEKIKRFRSTLGSYPLIIGAGLNPKNAYDQLIIADGCIVGSCFKPGGNTKAMVEKEMVKDFMEVVQQARSAKEKSALSSPEYL